MLCLHFAYSLLAISRVVILNEVHSTSRVIAVFYAHRGAFGAATMWKIHAVFHFLVKQAKFACEGTKGFRV